ncbi:MAG: 16S rRNA (guanine527-N7)-methyltransferase [Flammeovirgaceae bacterium]|jgi:16S rRNA (guanine527-N7)-methyltransferase
MIELLTQYFPEISEEKREKFAALQPLYEEWNAQINVISRKDMDQFEERHLLHSLCLTFFWQPKSGHKVLDIGTGGGFPGIPLAILYPDVDFLLIDSTAKKIKVVNEVAEALDLKNVKAVQDRAEYVVGRFDSVVSRAVARLSVLTEYCVNSKMKTKELICLKGGDLREEQEEVDRYPSVIYKLDSKINRPFFETKKVVKVTYN